MGFPEWPWQGADPGEGTAEEALGSSRLQAGLGRSAHCIFKEGCLQDALMTVALFIDLPFFLWVWAGRWSFFSLFLLFNCTFFPESK